MSSLPTLKLSLLSIAIVGSWGVIASEKILDPLTSFDHKTWWKSDGWSNGFPFNNRWEATSIRNNTNGMQIVLFKEPAEYSNYAFSSGELRSHDFYSYGCFEVEMKPIAKPGVISSFFLFAGPFDTPDGGNGKHNEIDIEFLGNNTNILQLNFWTNDNSYIQSHEKLIYLNFDASTDFHRYGIKWTKKYIQWFIDGEIVHQVNNTQSDPIPSSQDSKLRVMANVWPTDTAIANWAGEFDTSTESELIARYKNIRIQEGKNCKITH
ncbi:family 16 glycosylhydrolase [uncultured Photobacterium sp.]|uniref:family 16 glycosylhydrolase n=1 Tax=uncultured Photobacterium sp. TaxID=173973 RepID=UPI00262BD28C|nr:family 16 glycosylhydrolase [uncultured Photobacterium sp.]